MKHSIRNTFSKPGNYFLLALGVDMLVRNHPAVKSLERLITALVLRHPSGLRVLLGETKPLTADEWSCLLAPMGGQESCERVQRTPTNDGFFCDLARGIDAELLIEKIGGWNSVVQSARFIRENASLDWNLFVEAVRVKTTPLKSRIDGSLIDRIARQHGVSRKTLLRRLEIVPGTISIYAMGGIGSSAKKSTTGSSWEKE